MDDEQDRPGDVLDPSENTPIARLVWQLQNLSEGLYALQERAEEGANKATGIALPEFHRGREDAYFVARSWVEAIVEAALWEPQD